MSRGSFFSSFAEGEGAGVEEDEGAGWVSLVI